MRKLLITLLLLITAAAFSQNGSFNNLDVRATSKLRGLIYPFGAVATSPLDPSTHEVLMVDTGDFSMIRVDFQEFADSIMAAGGSYWTLAGNYLYPNNITDSVSIGKVNAEEALDVNGNIQFSTTSATSGQIKQAGFTLMHTYSDSPFPYVGSNIFLGTFCGNYTMTGNDNIAIGLGNLWVNTSGERNISIGNESLMYSTSLSGTTAIGHAALSHANGNSNTCIGEYSYTNDTLGISNTAIGRYTGYESRRSNYNVTIGEYSLQRSDSAYGNVSIGQSAMRGVLNTQPSENVAIGREALGNIETVTGNVAVGSQAGFSLDTAQLNTYVGYISGFSTVGENNTYLGAFTGYNDTLGYNNVKIGRNAGLEGDGHDNIFIGYNSGYSEIGSNKLYIENSNSATPLIYGDFAADSVVVNGDLNVTGNFIYERPHAFLNYKVTGNDTIGGASAGNLIAIANRWEWTKFALGFADTETHAFTLIATDTLRYDGTLAAHIKFDVPITTDGGNGNDFEMCIYNATDGAIISTRQAWTTTGSGNKNSITVSAYDVNANPGDKYVLKVRNLTNADDLNVFYCDIFAWVVHFE